MNTPLKLERERRGLFQNEIADAVGIERSHYSRIEMGKTTASAAVAKKIQVYFGKPITIEKILYPEDYIDAGARKPTPQTPELAQAS